MLGLPALTGCDSVSCFKGMGKEKPLKLLLKSPTYCDALKHLGDDWDLDESVIDGREKFTCAIYFQNKQYENTCHKSIRCLLQLLSS